MPEASPRHTAAIALGSNLPSPWGGREQNLNLAIVRLAELGKLLAASALLDTAPALYLDQPRFLNAAVLLETPLLPRPLMRCLLEIELALGRDRSEAAPPKGPRTLDLDLLLYDDLILQTPDLTLPHPALHQRRFVLEPLAEIAPGWLHPLLRKTVAELLAELPPQLA